MPYQVMNLPNVYGISNPQLWVIEKRPEVTWMPWFALGGSMGRAALGQGDMAALYEEQIRAMTDAARNLPNAEELFRHASVCSAQVATLRSAIQPQDVASRTADVEKCMNAFREKLEASRNLPAPKPAAPAPSPLGIPPVAWAVGALATLGVAAFAATRR